MAVLTATALVAACGTQAPEAADRRPAYEPGTEECADGLGGAPLDTQDGGTPTFDPEVGRIAMSADGNQHDNDDWASAPMALALLAHRNLQPNLVHYDYNDHIWDSSEEHLDGSYVQEILGPAILISVGGGLLNTPITAPPRPPGWPAPMPGPRPD